MNRELEFRCYDLTRDLMIYDSFLINWKGQLHNRPNNPNYIIMQYTGLSDKDGVKIWEGDIVKTEESDDVYEVIFYMGAFRSATLPNKIQVYDIGIHHIHNLEVIGNIYEKQTETKEQLCHGGLR